MLCKTTDVYEDQPMPLTDEQQAVVHSQSGALKVVAFAGTGKTSTLRAYAQARLGQKMLYLAFNNSIAQEAASRFTPNVTCLTTHSLAYRAVGKAYRHKLVTNIRANQAAKALGLNTTNPADLGFAFQSLQALKRFLSTSCVDLEEFALLIAEELKYQPAAVDGAARLWQAMCDISNEAMPMLHDGYLKLFQLTAPQLGFDTILFDEAQDANPVTLSILRQQDCAKVFVGDPHQQIYQFRYAENAMADDSLTDELFLTESFRFGGEVAAAANRLLEVKRERNRVSGNRLVPPSLTKACIARGNAALYKRAAELAHAKVTVFWVGGIGGYRLDLLHDIWHLRAGSRSCIKDRFVAGFDNFDALYSYANAQDERDLKAWIRVIDGHSRWQAIPTEIALVKSCSVSHIKGASLALTTVHKSKGLGFGSVELADDFPDAELANPVKYSRETQPLFWDEKGFRGAVLLQEEEINLRYVAITRSESNCTSGQWPAPLFQWFSDYILLHPRFLTLSKLTDLRCRTSSTPKSALQSTAEHVEIFTPSVAIDNPQTRKEVTGTGQQRPRILNVAEVVSAYERSYPLVRWELLAQRWQEKVTDVQELIHGHPLQSAQGLVAAFADALALAETDEPAPVLKSAVLQMDNYLTFTAEDEDRDFREWMNALDERHEFNIAQGAEDKLHGGLAEFYAEEKEIARQLGEEAKPDSTWSALWSAAGLNPKEKAFTLRKCFSEKELIEEYDSDYNLTKDERTIEIHFRKCTTNPNEFFIHAEPKPHISKDVSNLISQIKHSQVSSINALESFIFLTNKGFSLPAAFKSLKRFKPEDNEADLHNYSHWETDSEEYDD